MRQDSKPRQQEGNRQRPGRNHRLKHAEKHRPALHPIREPPARQSAHAKPGHVSAKDDADGVGTVAEDGDELAAPQYFENERSGAGQEKAGVDAPIQPRHPER